MGRRERVPHVRRITVEEYLLARRMSGDWLRSLVPKGERKTAQEWDVFVQKIRDSTA
jgi:hypothetical protein